MQLSLRIAGRYLLSKKSHGAVNVISAISVAGVAVATAAIVVVLSVFNGFTDLAASHFSIIDPDVMVTPARGKTIADADSLARSLAARTDVAAAVPTLTERGLLAGQRGQQGIVFKGVPDNYTDVIDLQPAVQAAVPDAAVADSCAAADLSVGVAMRMDLHPGRGVAELYVPRRVGRINPANPAGAFFSARIAPRAVLAVNQMEFDTDHIYIPLSTARGLLAYDTEASAVEIRAAAGTDPSALARELARELGPQYDVADRARQHAESYRMIAVEKWVTFAMLIFILVIAAFNIISTLSLMVIEKRDNMATLRFMGASRGMVRRVFALMGALITAAGGVLGIALGTALSLAQQWGGFIRLAGDPTKLAVSVYPVRVSGADILAVLCLIALMSLATSAITTLFTRKIE